MWFMHALIDTRTWRAHARSMDVGNSLNDEGAREIAAALSSTLLTHLDLSSSF